MVTIVRIGRRVTIVKIVVVTAARKIYYGNKIAIVAIVIVVLKAKQLESPPKAGEAGGRKFLEKQTLSLTIF